MVEKCDLMESKEGIDMANRKELPLGIDDFKNVSKNCYYVDKSELIVDLCSSSSGKAYLFTRPRRFGKSLALSMLETFFSIGEDNESYFKGLCIYKEKDIVTKYMNQYPVIHLDMKNVFSSSSSGSFYKAKETLQQLYAKCSFAFADLPDYEKKYVDKVLSLEGNMDEMSSALRRLSFYLYSYYKKKVIILIDEYDSPIRSAYENGYYDEVITFYKQLYGEALKGNEFLEKAVLTGILQVAKESLFSGLNNLEVNSVVSSYTKEPFGFLEKEVDEILAYYGYSDHKKEVDEYYGGYRFGTTRVYNPLSVISYLHEGKKDLYWINTGENHLLGKLFERFSENKDQSSFSQLLAGEEVLSKVNIAISYLDIDKDDNALFSYLLSAGYLTFTDSYEDSLYALKIPNKEIQGVFANEITSRYIKSKDLLLAHEIKKSFRTGDSETLEKQLEKYLLSSFSYYEFGNEKSYQVLMLVMASLLFEDSLVKSEVNEGLGRADIIVTPYSPNGVGIIIEVKCVKGKISSSRLKETSLAALRQIKRKDYAEGLRNKNIKKIISYGVAFYKKEVKVSTEIL